MKKTKINTNFSTYRDTDLDAAGKAIDLAMTGHPQFPELAADVTVVHDASMAYSLALAGRHTGGPDVTARKETARAALVAALRTLGIKINLKAEGNEELLRTTGYPLAAARVRKGRLAQPEGFKATPVLGTHGEMKLEVDPVDGAKNYLFQYTKAPAGPESSWTNCISSRSVCYVAGLESRAEYVFRVSALGSDPSTVFSEEIRSNVL